MNALTQTQQARQFNGSSPLSEVTVELAKALALVAPITMSSEQQELWLRAAVDALQGIRADEISAVSLELRRSVTRPSQIVPEIAKLVSERRSFQSRMRELDPPALPGPKRVIPVMERRGQPMSEAETGELNEILEKLGATARYRADGSRYMIEAAA